MSSRHCLGEIKKECSKKCFSLDHTSQPFKWLLLIPEKKKEEKQVPRRKFKVKKINNDKNEDGVSARMLQRNSLKEFFPLKQLQAKSSPFKRLVSG